MDWVWTPKIVAALSDADRPIGRLAGECARLPNPHLLMRPFLRREAVLSSRIEGTQATLGELLVAEAGAAVARGPNDLREVGNYIAALEHGLKRLAEIPLSLRRVKELHAVLMDRVRGRHAMPGQSRRSPNWIGPPGCTVATATFMPPPPFLYLSAFFEATRCDYYECLLNVSLRNEWEAWVEYFLRAVARQSEDAPSRAERINELLEQWRVEVSGMPAKTLSLVLNMFAANPFVTAKQVAERPGVAFTTAQRAIGKPKKPRLSKRSDMPDGAVPIAPKQSSTSSKRPPN